MKNMTDELASIGFSNKNLNNLNKEYNEALKDSSFKAIIDKLNFDEKVLIKYTSTLKDCASEYSNCLKCKGLINCQNKILGHAYMPKIVDNNLFFNYQMCKYQKKNITQTKYQANIYLFDVPKDIKDATMDDIDKKDKNRFDVIEWLYKFMVKYKENKEQKGLFLHGSFGCGKTYLVAALFNELAKDNIKSAIIFWPEYLRDLKASFDTDFKQKYNYIKKVPILLIDDIGAESNTSWGRDEILCPLLQYRMDEKLPTFLTSNLNINELEEHLSFNKNSVEIVKAKRIISRIEQLTDDIEMISKNLRK